MSCIWENVVSTPLMTAWRDGFIARVGARERRIKEADGNVCFEGRELQKVDVSGEGHSRQRRADTRKRKG